MSARLGDHAWILPHLAVAVFLLLTGPVQADCTVSASGVVFGSYNPLSFSEVDGAGTIGVDCAPSASFSVSLSSGGGSFNPRRMNSGADTLNYNLYTNASRSIIWGDGTGGTSTVGGTGESVNLTVYGRIPAGQNRHPGSYSDTLIVTVNF